MRHYYESMIKEKEDLEGKIKRAKKALEASPYGMNKTQKALLVRQIKAMEKYLNILNERNEYEATIGS